MRRLVFPTAQIPFSAKHVIISLFIHGAVSISWQILLIRSVMSVFQGNEILIGFCFFFYLFWMATGSWFGGRVLSRFGQTPLVLVAMFSLAAFSMPLSLFLLTGLKYFFFVSALTIISAYQALLITFIISAPFCFLAGGIFPLCIKILPESANAPLRQVSQAYGYESMGSGLGTLLVFFLIIPNVQPMNAALFLATFSCCAGLVLVCSRPFFRAVMVFPAVSALLFVCLGFTDILHKHQKSLQWPGMTWVAGQNTRHGYLEIVRLGEQNNIYLNGTLLATSDFDAISLKSVQIAMGQTPAPRKILLLGSGLTGCINELRHYRVGLCDYVNSNDLEVEWSKTYITPLTPDSPEYNMHVMDERGFIRNAPPEQYDLIIINRPSPTSLQLNRFYTIEFFREVSRALDKNGIMMLIMDVSSVELTSPNLRFLATVARTMSEVFPSKIIMPGSPSIFLASRQEKYMLSDQQLQIMQAFSGGVSITPMQMAGLIRQQYDSTGINSDFRPVGMLINLDRGIHRYLNPLPGLADYAGTLKTKKLIPYSVVGFCLFVILCVGLGRSSFFTPFMTFLIGFSSMAYQIIILFLFQIVFGDLYYHIGILVSLFMAGIALGSFYHIRIRARSPVEGMQIIIPGVFLAFVGLSFAIFLLISGRPISLHFFIFGFACGALNGLVFPLLVSLASTDGRPDPVSSGRIYAWDSIGAGAGALTAGPLMVGLLGGYESLLLLAGINGVILITSWIILSQDRL